MTKYNDQTPIKVKEYKAQCARNDKPYTALNLSNYLGVNVKNIYNWRKQHKAFAEALGDLAKGNGERAQTQEKYKRMVDMHKETGDMDAVCYEFNMIETTVARVFRRMGYDYKQNTVKLDFKIHDHAPERVEMSKEDNFCREHWDWILTKRWAA